MKKYNVNWQVEGGYVGGERPQSFTVTANHFFHSETLQDITESLEDMMEEDFNEKVSLVGLNVAEVAKQIFDELQAGEAE